MFCLLATVAYRYMSKQARALAPAARLNLSPRSQEVLAAQIAAAATDTQVPEKHRRKKDK